MPTYVYEFIMDDGLPGARFEVRQKLSDPPLTEHPISKQAVRRVITVPNLGGKYSESAIRDTLNDHDRLSRLGLAKYQRTGDGSYLRMSGEGPRELDPQQIQDGDD